MKLDIDGRTTEAIELLIEHNDLNEATVKFIKEDRSKMFFGWREWKDGDLLKYLRDIVLQGVQNGFQAWSVQRFTPLATAGDSLRPTDGRISTPSPAATNPPRPAAIKRAGTPCTVCGGEPSIHLTRCLNEQVKKIDLCAECLAMINALTAKPEKK